MLALLRWLVEAVFWLVVGAMVLAALTLLVAPIAWYAAPVVALFLLVVAARMLHHARQRRALTVVSHVEQAVRLNLPLPTMLAAAAASERGATRRRLKNLDEAVRSGMELGPAFRDHLPELRLDSVTLIGAAERLGRLPAALRRATEKQRRWVAGEGPDHTAGWAYIAMVTCITLVLVGGMMVLIVPQFESIFEDFDTQLPWSTVLTIAIARDFAGWILLAAVAGVLGMAAASTAGALHPAFARREVIGPLLDHLVYAAPLVGSAARDRALADACSLVADGLKSGADLPVILAEAGELRVNAVMARRLGNFAAKAAGGASLQEAARRARLPRLMRGMLGSIDQGSDAKQVFRFLATYYDARSSWLHELARAAFVPAAVLVMALLIGWIVVSLFQPLVTLIWATVDATELY